MSTNARKSERDRAFAVGCTTYLTKPFWVDNLFAQLPDITVTPFSSNPHGEGVCYAAAQTALII
jgi:CheY-like chemotaxis protein